MPGISRAKTWVAKEVLTYTDLNNEFDNIINNLSADNVDGYSASVAQMRETTDPGGIGSESLALRISDEIERIRFAINRIVGKTYWYEAPSRSLQATYVDASLYLQANPYVGSSAVTEAASESMLAGFIDSDNFDDTNWLDATNKKMSDTAFAFKNDPTDSRYFYMDTAKTSATSSTLSFWFRNFAANDTIFYNTLSGLRVYLNANGYLKLDQETSDSVSNGTKVTQSITGTSSLAGSTSFNNVIVRFRYGNAATDQVDLLLNGTLVGSISGSILPINVPVAPGNKSVIMASRSPNPTTYALTFPTTSGLPASNGWNRTSTGSITENSTSGILTITAAATTDTNYYTRTSASATFPSGAIPTNGQFIETKFKFGANVGAVTDAATTGAPFGFYIHNATSALGVLCRITPDEITFNRPDSASARNPVGTEGPLLSIAHNFLQWTHLFFVIKPTIAYVFINGELKGSFVPQADTSANNELIFGKLTSSNVAPTIQMEYFYFGSMAGTNPDFYLENATNVQQISDPCAIRGFITDSSIISSLQQSSPFTLFGKSQRTSNFVTNRAFGLATSVGTGASAVLGTAADFYSDGVTPVKINCIVIARPSALTAGSYAMLSYLKLARTSDGNAQHATALVSSTTTGYSALTNLSAAFGLDCVVNQGFQAIMPIQTAMILPAGKYTATAVFTSLSTAATMIVNKVTCSVSN